jgi:hypothetical protein
MKLNRNHFAILGALHASPNFMLPTETLKMVFVLDGGLEAPILPLLEELRTLGLICGGATVGLTSLGNALYGARLGIHVFRVT